MATQVTVSGLLVDPSGVGLSGTIEFTPSQPLYDTDGNLIVGTVPTVATLTSGSFSVVVYATDDANTSPEGATYTISESLTNSAGTKQRGRGKFKAEIPSASATLRYEDITEALPSSRSTQSYASLAALTSHYSGITAHDADAVTYTGAVAGASTVEEALDTLESSKATTGYVDDAATTLSTLLQAGYNALAPNDIYEPETNWRHIDDMVGGTSSTLPDGWLLSTSGTGAGVADVSATEGLPGVKALETGTTTTGSSFATLDFARMPGDTVGTMWARVRFGVVDGDPLVEDWIGYVGLFEGLGTAGAFLTASPGTANWQCVTSDGSTTVTDSGVAIAGGAWRWLKIERTASSVIFSIDGSVVATHTTNLPTSGDQIRPTFWMLKSVGTTNRRMQIDVVSFDYEFSRGTMG